MIEVADVFRQFGGAYLAAFGKSMLPSHERGIRDIIRCRSEVMGGNLYQCDTCHYPVLPRLFPPPRSVQLGFCVDNRRKKP